MLISSLSRSAACLRRPCGPLLVAEWRCPCRCPQKQSLASSGCARPATTMHMTRRYGATYPWSIAGAQDLLQPSFHGCEWGSLSSQQQQWGALRVVHRVQGHQQLLCPRRRWYSRLIRDSSKKELSRNKHIKAKSFVLIDHDGTDLGLMDRDTALKLASARGLEVILVQKERDDSKAVCRLSTKKEIWDANKQLKQVKKKNPPVETKELKIRTTILNHDFDVKLKNAIRFFGKRHNVKLYIEPKAKYVAGTPEEQREQKKLFERFETSVKEYAEKHSNPIFQGERHKLIGTFKSKVKAPSRPVEQQKTDVDSQSENE